MYVIDVFCTIVASMASAAALASINWPLLLFVLFAIFGSMLLQSLLCRLAGRQNLEPGLLHRR
jgi:hypothetical protein